MEAATGPGQEDWEAFRESLAPVRGITSMSLKALDPVSGPEVAMPLAPPRTRPPLGESVINVGASLSLEALWVQGQEAPRQVAPGQEEIPLSLLASYVMYACMIVGGAHAHCGLKVCARHIVCNKTSMQAR